MAWPDELKIRLEPAMKTCLVSTLILNAILLGGCGGGASSSVAESGLHLAIFNLKSTRIFTEMWAAIPRIERPRSKLNQLFLTINLLTHVD